MTHRFRPLASLILFIASLFASIGVARADVSEETLYHLLLGEMAIQRGQLDVATNSLLYAARQMRDARLAERATQAALAAKRYDDLLQAAKLWSELAPASTEAREAHALALLELNRPAEARQEFLLLVSAEGNSAGLQTQYLRIAETLGRASNRQAALALMQELVKKHTDLAAGHYALSVLAVRAGDMDLAEKSVTRALELKSDWQEAALFKTRILISGGQAAAAQRYFEQFVAAHPAATNMRVEYARFLIDQKQWDAAREQFKRVVSDMPENADALYAVGLLALETNHLDEAESYLKRNLALRPDNDQARLYLGEIAEQNKRYNDAARWYREIDDTEHVLDAQTRLAVVTAKLGDLAKARAILQSIPAETDAQRVQVVVAESQLLRDARKYREALDVLNTAIVRRPQDVDLLYARSMIADRLDMLPTAEADLRTILKGDPKNANALNALGYMLADRTNRYDEAQTLLKQALELKPDDPFILDSMGWLLYRQGNRSEALKYLKRALTLRSDAEIAAHLGEVLWVSGERGEAETVWTRALRDTPESEVLRDVIKKFKP